MFTAIQVDLKSNVVLSDAELDVRCDAIIDITWPVKVREQAIRTGTNKPQLDQFFIDLGVNKKIASAKYAAIAVRVAEDALANNIKVVPVVDPTATPVNVAPPVVDPTIANTIVVVIPNALTKEDLLVAAVIQAKRVRDAKFLIVGRIVADAIMSEINMLNDIAIATKAIADDIIKANTNRDNMAKALMMPVV